GVWRTRAASIRQRRMRSESDGHVAPTSFPGLAVREARRRGSLGPLVPSVLDRYHPTVTEFLDHVAEARERSGWDESFVAARIKRVRTVEDGFELDGHGRFRHVLLAPGHPGLAVPPELRAAPRAPPAYEPHADVDHVTVARAATASRPDGLDDLEAVA